eukprot:3902909-Pleurochrysis_carterae.AAC.1
MKLFVHITASQMLTVRSTLPARQLANYIRHSSLPSPFVHVPGLRALFRSVRARRGRGAIPPRCSSAQVAGLFKTEVDGTIRMKVYTTEGALPTLTRQRQSMKPSLRWPMQCTRASLFVLEGRVGSFFLLLYSSRQVAWFCARKVVILHLFWYTARDNANLGLPRCILPHFVNAARA